jgi:hypothetical protein
MLDGRPGGCATNPPRAGNDIQTSFNLTTVRSSGRPNSPRGGVSDFFSFRVAMPESASKIGRVTASLPVALTQWTGQFNHNFAP